MRVARKPLSGALSYYLTGISSSSSSSYLISRTLNTCPRSQLPIQSPEPASRGALASPWSATQFRGAKYRGSDVKPGNVIERKGKVYQVLKAQHTVQGRGGACIQVELRDVDSGNKINERLRTDEAIEKMSFARKEYKLLKEIGVGPCNFGSYINGAWKGSGPIALKQFYCNSDAEEVFVEEKPYTYLYSEDDVVVLSEPNTYDQLDVPKELFGEAAVYLKDEMAVTVQLFDGRPMSASVPQRVTCKVVEAQVPMKGIAATPHYKKVLLDNGLTVQVPAHVLAGDQIVINTSDNSYITRA